MASSPGDTVFTPFCNEIDWVEMMFPLISEIVTEPFSEPTLVITNWVEGVNGFGYNSNARAAAASNTYCN